MTSYVKVGEQVIIREATSGERKALQTTLNTYCIDGAGTTYYIQFDSLNYDKYVLLGGPFKRPLILPVDKGTLGGELRRKSFAVAAAIVTAIEG